MMIDLFACSKAHLTVWATSGSARWAERATLGIGEDILCVCMKDPLKSEKAQFRGFEKTLSKKELSQREKLLLLTLWEFTEEVDTV